MKRFVILAALAAAPIAATWAHAAGGPAGDFHDPKSGFEVKVPVGFVQMPAVPADGRSVLLKRAADDYVFCFAHFKPDDAPGGGEARGVKEIARAWRASAMGKGQAFVSAAPLGPRRSGPPEAVAIVSDRRGDHPSFPRQRRRSLTILWETPKGVTSLACEAPKVRFGILRREFEALAGGVTPPR